MSIAHIVGLLKNTTVIVVPAVTWNPLDTNVFITLSGGNLVMTKSATVQWVSGRATVSKTSGKYYFEVQMNSFAGSFIAAGIGNASANLVAYAGQNTNSISVVTDGSFFYNATSVASGLGAFSSSDVLGVAVDITAGRVWFRRNAGSWYGAATITGAAVVGDPGLGTNGRPLTITGPYFPMGSVQSNGSPGDVLTGRFRLQDFSYLPPIGFTPWEENAIEWVNDQRLYTIVAPALDTEAVGDQREYVIVAPALNTEAVSDQRMYVIVQP